MELLAVITVIGLLYIWPALLSELHLYRAGRLSAIKLRLKLYGISYATWMLFGAGYLLAIHQLDLNVVQYAASCESRESGCSQLYLGAAERIHEWGAFLVHAIAALCAWYLLQRRRDQI